jgi:hypothetical protein
MRWRGVITAKQTELVGPLAGPQERGGRLVSAEQTSTQVEVGFTHALQG